MKKSRKWLFAPLLIVAVALVTGAGVMGLQQSPRGISTPYWYGYSSGAPASYYLSMPTLSANDEAVGKAATQTLTNKTITSPVISNLTASKPVFTDSSKVLTSTGTLGVDQGGTNLASYTAGDLLYASGATTLAKLGKGTAFQSLQMNAGDTAPAWASGETLLSTTTWDLSADGNETILTTPTGRRTILTKAVVVAAADCGSTDFTIGQTGALTDFLNTQQTDNLNAQYDAAIFMPVPNATAVGIKSYAGGTVIKAAVANHAGAAGNTLYLFGIVY